MDAFLADTVFAFTLANKHQVCVAARKCQHIAAHKPIINNNVSLLQRAVRFDRQQVRVAGSCTNQLYLASGGAHAVVFRGFDNQAFYFRLFHVGIKAGIVIQAVPEQASAGAIRDDGFDFTAHIAGGIRQNTQ